MKHTKIFILCFVVFVVAKFIFSYIDIELLKPLLAPTSKLVGMICGTSSVYQPQSGYFHPELDIVINKSCSGFNFLLISFLMTAFVFASTSMRKWMVVPSSLMIAYLATIFANASRIITYLMLVGNNAIHTFTHSKYLHQAQGVFVYLTLLIFLYFVLDRLTNKLKY